MFGIKNARRSAGQDKLVLGCGVNQLIAGRLSAWLGDDYLIFGDDVIDLSCSTPIPAVIPELLAQQIDLRSLIPRLEEHIHLSRDHCEVGSFGLHSFVKMGFAFAVGVAEARGCDLYRRDFSTLFRLNQHGGNRLCRRSPRDYRTAVAIELDCRGLDDVGILPKAGISGVESNRRSAMGGHGSRGHMDRIGGSQKGAAGLRFQVAVGALDVAVGEGVAGCPVHAHAPRRGGHASIDDSGGNAENQDLVGGSVGGTSTPGLTLAILVGNASLLHDGINAAAGMKRCVQHGAGADAVRLARGLRHDASVGRAMHSGQLPEVVEAGLKLASRNQGLPGRRVRLGGGRSGPAPEVSARRRRTAAGQHEIDGGGGNFDVLCLGVASAVGSFGGLLSLQNLHVVFGLYGG